MAKNLRQRLGTGIVLAAAGLGSLISGGCATQSDYQKTFNSLSPEEKVRWKQAEYNLCVQSYERDKKEQGQTLKMHEDFRKVEERLQTQNNYQTSPQQNNLEKNVEKAITHGAGEFIGEVLIQEYFKK